MEASYVRAAEIPDKKPPVSQTGALGWIRENLFSTPLNAVMTVGLVAFIAYLLYLVVPWAWYSSWTAGSLNECREQIQAFYGEGTQGACWAVIRDRYLQMIYGFYPRDLYWRPNAAFLLLLASLAPVLFPRVPRLMLLITFTYPLAAFLLLWGGNFMWAIAFFGALAAAVAAFKVAAWRHLSFRLSVALAAAAVAAWLALAYLVNSIWSGSFVLRPVESANFGGFMLSVTIGITGIAASLPIGILLALGRRSDLIIIKALCVGFIEFIRGVPLITLLFVASTLLNIFMPPGSNFDIIFRVIVMVTLFSSAYLAEVIRGGLAALPVGQYEAGDALGLNYWKQMSLIILPQALKISIPAIVSTFIGLFKDTTLVSIIGLFDPLGLSTAIRANVEWNGVIWELYGFIALIFFILCYSMSRYSMHLERRLATGHN